MDFDELEDLHGELNDICEMYEVELLNAEFVDKDGKLIRLPQPTRRATNG